MTDRTTTYDPTAPRAGESFTDSDRERARQAAEEIKTAAKDAAANTASALKNRLSGELDYRKYRSRQKLNRVAEALRHTGSNVNQEDEYVARYMERAAEGVDRVADYLDSRDVNQILHDAREMARRRPEVFVGGLFVAGLVLGRFLRSSAPDEGYAGETWDGSPAYAGSGSYGTNPYGPTSSYGGVSTSGAANPYAGTSVDPKPPVSGGSMS